LQRGQSAYDALAKPAVPSDARGLSALNEEQLEHGLLAIADPALRADAIAYLRAHAPFVREAQTSSMAVAYAELARGLDAYEHGDRDAARRAFIAAYLDGVEPHEAGLRARDPELVAALEAAMLQLRSDAAQGVPQAQLETRVKGVRELLARAEHGKADASAAFIGAFAIALREGLEIMLLVAALLGLVRKRGQPELAKYVHAGWLLAIPAGVVTYIGAESVLSGMQRELAEGLASLVAALVLLGVTHWLIGQLSAKRWVEFLARRVGAAVNSRRAAWGVLGLAFVAAYREAFEIVLFFQALTRDAGSARQVALGAATGLLLLCAVAFALLRAGQKLKPAPFMLASSICLALLSFMLVGKGVHALQEAGVVPLTLIGLRDVAWLGLYGSVESLAAQGLLVLALIASALWPLLTSRSGGLDERHGRA